MMPRTIRDLENSICCLSLDALRQILPQMVTLCSSCYVWPWFWFRCQSLPSPLVVVTPSLRLQADMEG